VAGVAIPVILALVYVGGWPLTLLVALLAALGAAELCALAEARGARPLTTMALVATAILVLGAGATPTLDGVAHWGTGAVLLTALLGMVASLGVRWPGDGPLRAVSVTVLAPVYVGVPLAFILLIRRIPEVEAWTHAEALGWAGLAAVLYPLACTWIADATAYFVGSTWGRRKLAPSMSPNKSVEGALASLGGGAAVGALWAVAVDIWFPGAAVTVVGAAVGGVLLSVGAQIGDLVESVLKREAGVKDSGGIFPGHGGALDRLDALIFTVPMAYGILSWLGRLP